MSLSPKKAHVAVSILGVKGHIIGDRRYSLELTYFSVFSGCDVYMRMVSSLSVGAGSGKTKLDKHRIKSCEAQIVSYYFIKLESFLNLHIKSKWTSTD